MKKITNIILLTALLTIALLPVIGYAQAPDTCEIKADPSNYVPTDWNCPTSGECVLDSPDMPCALCCTVSMVLYATNIIFVGIMIVVVILVLLGAFNILTAAGDTDKINKGRDYILYAAVGMAIALIAKGVPMIVRFLIT